MYAAAVVVEALTQDSRSRAASRLVTVPSNHY